MLASELDEKSFAYMQALAENYPTQKSFEQLGTSYPILDGVKRSRIEESLPRSLANIRRAGAKERVLKLPAIA